MTSSFERHGIDHLSASSVNLFAAEPALWVMERLLGRRGKVGAAAHRGSAVERGVTAALMEDKPDEECIEVASAEYKRLTALSSDPNREKEGEALAKLTTQAISALKPYGRPSSTQRRIEWHCDSLPVPFVGYLDFEWAEHGIIVDLKTQLRLASSISRSHARQGALYGAATTDNASVRFCYATPAKHAVYPLENQRGHLDALLKIAATMQRFLALSGDPHELAGLIVPDVDSFYFSDPTTRQAAFEVYGI